jgi:hypothetical protein
MMCGGLLEKMRVLGHRKINVPPSSQGLGPRLQPAMYRLCVCVCVCAFVLEVNEKEQEGHDAWQRKEVKNSVAAAKSTRRACLCDHTHTHTHTQRHKQPHTHTQKQCLDHTSFVRGKKETRKNNKTSKLILLLKLSLAKSSERIPCPSSSPLPSSLLQKHTHTHTYTHTHTPYIQTIHRWPLLLLHGWRWMPRRGLRFVCVCECVCVCVFDDA